MNPEESTAGPAAPREAAFEAVEAVLRGVGFAADVIRRRREDGRLDPRSAGLAMETALGAVRHAVTIEHVLSRVARYNRYRTRAPLRAILLTAAYQVIWMDRVPLFAAVDQAVRLTRRHVGGKAPGMVNAVLRSLTRAILERRVPWNRLDPTQVRVSWDQACAFDRAVLPRVTGPDPPLAYLAAATSERHSRFRMLVERYGPAAAEDVAWAGQAVPVLVLHRNPLRCPPEEFVAGVRAAWGDEADCGADVAYVPGGAGLSGCKLFEEGKAYVQDTTARSAAELLGAEPGQRVLDLCAAPGGKTLALALRMEDRGLVVACDASAERLARVAENAARLGLTCVQTSPPPDAEGVGLFAEPFDAVLVDVPCSNTGVIARRPEARLGFTKKKLASLVPVQRELLAQAARHVRPGGCLVYSTCSLEPEENEQLVATFLLENTAWRLDRERTTLPAWGPRCSDWRDGGYAARLVRAER